MGVRFIDGTIRMGKKFPRRQFAQFLGMSWADRIIANSQAGLDVWEIATPKGKVVYNGFEPERLSLCVSPKTKSAFFTVVMVGRMTFEKDFQTFFKAARTLLVDAETTWHFMAIGKGVDYKNHLETNKDLVEKGQLEILDGGTEVLPLLNQAQVGVLISTFGEGCSNAIMEYMACGLPVICNDSGGNRELVIDGETGFLIPNGDCQALVSKLAYLRDNPYEAERLGQAGRQRLLTHYTVDVLVQETIRVYKEVI